MSKWVRVIFIFGLFFSIEGLAQSTQQMTIEKMRFGILQIDKGIDSTKQKIKSVSDAEFLPDLYMSLAEFYVKKSKLQYALKIAENPKVPVNELDFSIEKKTKALAIDAYNMVIDKFPKYQLRDKAIFFKAHEHREMGSYEDMVTTYAQLTKEYPESVYWLESQIILGDYFFDTLKKVDMALEVYKRVLTKPISPFTPLAHYKMGWCYINLNQFNEALVSFENVLLKFKDIDLNALPEDLRKTDVRKEALSALVWPYSEVDHTQPHTSSVRRTYPISYLKALAPNKTALEDALLKLGRRLSVKGDHVSATRVLFEVLRMKSQLEEKIDLIPMIYVSMKNSQFDWPIRGFVEEIAKVVPKIRTDESLSKKEKAKYLFDFEIYARDVATRQDERSRRTKETDDLKWTIRDYEIYLTVFPSNKFTKKIELNLADVYFLSGDYTLAGKLFEELARTSKAKTQFLKSSLESYIAALRDPDKLNELELTESRYGLRTTGANFVRLNKKDKSVPDVLFNIGQSYYDERNFKLANRYLKYFVNNFPQDKNAVTAVNLILDGFNQIEDYKSIVKEGKALLKSGKIISDSLKAQVTDIIQQAELKIIQVESGDASSDNYASNLLKMATKYKGSSLGDKALFEAFLAYKAKRDPRLFQVGTELALRHKNSQHALPVITEMGQLALDSGNFENAALFFELFYERYPNKPERSDLLKSAAEIRSLLGQYKIASKNYQLLGLNTDAARMDFLGQHWTELSRTAVKANGVWRDYWIGLANYRMRGLRSAKPYLERTSAFQVSSPEEKTAAAHALYLLASNKLESFKNIKIELGQEVKAVNEKAAMLKSIEQDLNRVIQFGDGRWAIAALYGLGQSYAEFAKFLAESPMPKGLSPADQKAYRQAILAQAKTFQGSANQYFGQCIQTAQKFIIFSQFVRACHSRGKMNVDEASEERRFSRPLKSEPSGVDGIRQQLLADSRNVELLNRLSEFYFRNQDFAFAELIQKRIMEISDKKSSAMGRLGVISLHKGQYDDAYSWFKKALSIDQRQKEASFGITGLLSHFLYKSEAEKWRRMKSGAAPNPFSHPFMGAD